MATLWQTWRWGGRIGGGRFLLIGIVLFIVKFALDLLISSGVFHRSRGWLDIIAPVTSLPSLSPARGDIAFYSAMLLLTVPFAIVGILLTLNRLRDADLPRWLIVLFFVPVVNVLYFVVLACVPSRADAVAAAIEPTIEASPPPPPPPPPPPLNYATDDASGGWWRFLPEEGGRSAAIVSCITAPIVLGLTVLAVKVLKNYGLGLFIGMPFILGLVSSVLHGVRKPRSMVECMTVATFSVLVAAVTFVLFAIEGILCVAMLLPLAIALALLGAAVGYTLQLRPQRPGYTLRSIVAPTLFLPLLMTIESRLHAPAPQCCVTTVIEIAAPPAFVWRNVT